MAGYTKYDFEALKNKRFPNMSDLEIMEEYTKVLREQERLACVMEDREFLNFSEPLINAELYLAGYLARLVCFEHGLDV